MRVLNGTTYSFALLHTGIISEVLKNRHQERSALVKLMTGDDVIPCISIWSILEMRARQDLYSTFVDLFSVIPFCLIRDPYNLFQDELNSYPDPSCVDPIALSLSMFSQDPLAQTQRFIPLLFQDPEIKKAEKSWGEQWKSDTLHSILSLRGNFPPSRGRYTAADATRFIADGVFQYVAGRAPAWTSDLVRAGRQFDPSAFPSIKTMFYTVFYTFYAEQREPELQDVFDVLIANAAPYLDIVITERFQAEIFRKVQRRDPFIEHLRVETLDLLRPGLGAG